MYNEKLQSELINHINLNLKIACIQRGIFTQLDFYDEQEINVLSTSDIQNISKVTSKELKMNEKNRK